MRQNYSFSKNGNALLEPCEGKLSCTVLRGESPSNGADLLDKQPERSVCSIPPSPPACVQAVARIAEREYPSCEAHGRGLPEIGSFNRLPGLFFSFLCVEFTNKFYICR